MPSLEAHVSRMIRLITEEPYRFFFPLGILMGVAGIGHWSAYALGWMKTYSPFFHSSVQMQASMSCFVIGFLLTAMPRFASAPHATRGEVALFLGLILGISFFLSLGAWVFAEIGFISLLATLAGFAIRRFRKRNPLVQPPMEFVWIPIAIFHGILGSLLLIIAQLRLAPFWLLAVGKPMEEQGFLLSMVLGVGGFLAPRLMGRAEPLGPSGSAGPDKIQTAGRRSILIHLAAGALLFLSFWLEGFGARVLAYGLRASIVTGELVFNRILPRPPRGWLPRCRQALAPAELVSSQPRVPDLFVKLLWISMWMIFLGSWMLAFFPSYRTAMLHLIFIGGFSLMTFAVGTMVTLSHSGDAAALRKPLAILKLIAAGLAFATVLRIGSVFIPQSYFQLLGMAAACWILAGISWLCFISPRILRVPAGDEFERCHEEAQGRILEIKKSEECCHGK